MTWATRNIGAARAGIAIFVLFLLGLTLASLFMFTIPPANKDIVLLVVGGLVNLSGIVGGFYFGVNSRGRTGP